MSSLPYLPFDEPTDVLWRRPGTDQLLSTTEATHLTSAAWALRWEELGVDLTADVYVRSHRVTEAGAVWTLAYRVRRSVDGWSVEWVRS